MLSNPDPANSVFSQVDIRLGQRTLSALKLINRSTYHKAVAASKVWLQYVAIDLFEELEDIRELRIQLWKLFDELSAFNGGENEGMARADSHHYTWISQMELSAVYWRGRRLREAEHELWVDQRV